MLALLAAKLASPALRAGLIAAGVAAAFALGAAWLHSVKQAGVTEEQARETAAASEHQASVVTEAAKVDSQIRLSPTKPQDALRKGWERPQ